MSHLFPEKVTVWLSIDSMTFIKSSRKKTQENSCVLVMPFDQNDALKSIDRALDQYKEKHSRAARLTVVVSNAFVQYLLLESQSEIKSFEEERVYVEYKYRQVFDQLASTLEFSWDTGLNSRSIFSSAIPEKLISSLKDSCKRHGFGLDSVQPYLMVLFNRVFNKPENKTRCAVIEGGQFIYFEIVNGQFLRLHQRYCPEDLNAHIDVLLQRENLLSHVEQDSSKMVVFTSSNNLKISHSLASVHYFTPENLIMHKKSHDLTVK